MGFKQLKREITISFSNSVYSFLMEGIEPLLIFHLLLQVITINLTLEHI